MDAGRRRWPPRSRWDVVAVGLVALFASSSAGCLEESSWPSEGAPVYSHDGTWVAFTRRSDGRDEIYVARRGAAATQVTRSAHGVSPSGFDWSPDGSKIVFVPATGRLSSRGLFVVDRDGRRLRRLTRGDDYGPCWTADGRTIVFRRGWSDVRAIGVDGAGDRLLVRSADLPSCPPAGSAIAFVGIRGWTSVHIGVLDLRTGRRWTIPRTTDEPPSWSPDGHRIAFSVLRPLLPSDPEFEHRSMFADGDWYLTEICVADADGTGVRRITKNAVGDNDPVWLPDGRILFESNRTGPVDFTNSDDFGYYVMESDGTGVDRFEWKPTYS